MTTATKQLLQKGDRITGKTPKGTPYTGTFEGYNTKDLVLCHTGEKTIALNPATVEHLAGHGNDPTRVQPALPLLQEEPVATCDRCHHGELKQAAEGLAVSCAQNRFAGAVIAGEMIAQVTAQACDGFEAKIKPELQAEALEVVIKSDTLDDEIAALHQQAMSTEDVIRQASLAAVDLYIALGEKLEAKKAQLQHGEWTPWLKQKGIHPRTSQRAISFWEGRDKLEAAKNDTQSVLTIQQAAAIVSKKAQPDQESGVSGQVSALTPESIEAQFALTGDLATPTLEQLMTLYAQLGTVRRWKQHGFSVERDDMGAPFPLAFRDRASAWKRWQAEWRSFAVDHPLSATEPPAQASEVIPEKTEGLQGENQGIDPYEYEPIDPIPVWFDPGGGVVEGQAIASNGKGMMRITWGEDRESDVPRDRVYLSDPTTVAEFQPVPEFDAQGAGGGSQGDALEPTEAARILSAQTSETLSEQESDRDRFLLPNGLAAERPTGSRWLPQEVDNVARIQLQGLLKHLEPAELVKAAIVHSGASPVDAVRVAVEMASGNEVDEIHELAQRKALETIK